MNSVFVLQHLYEPDKDQENIKFIGVYRSQLDAKAAVNRLLKQPGFIDEPNGFHIDEYELNKDHWSEGFTRTNDTIRKIKEIEHEAFSRLLTEHIHVSKLDAARRQLDVAIRLLFNGGDPIAVHTLVGAASVIISDLVDKHHPNNSWDKFAQEANKITASEYFQIMRKPQNFLKHARNDADAILDFDPKDTESVAFWAVMNLGNWGELSMEASVLQLWYLACHAPTLDSDLEPYNRALEIFGDLRDKPRTERLRIAKRVLAEQLTDERSS